MVDGQWMDDSACLYYKLTNESKGSGELKIILSVLNFFIWVLRPVKIVSLILRIIR